MLISPIDSAQQEQVITQVQHYIQRAEQHYGQRFEAIPVKFDLKGKTAGMFRIKMNNSSKPEQLIRFNPWIFAKYPQDSWENTIPHEVAHYIAHCLYGLAIRPHGKEWQAVMQVFGAKASVRTSYDLAGIPMRKVKRYDYVCGCQSHSLSHYRHRQIQQGLKRYYCRRCREQLVLVNSKDSFYQ